MCVFWRSFVTVSFCLCCVFVEAGESLGVVSRNRYTKAVVLCRRMTEREDLKEIRGNWGRTLQWDVILMTSTQGQRCSKCRLREPWWILATVGDQLSITQVFFGLFFISFDSKDVPTRFVCNIPRIVTQPDIPDTFISAPKFKLSRPANVWQVCTLLTQKCFLSI